MSSAACFSPTARPSVAVKGNASAYYAGGESEAAKTMIAECCDAYVMHGDPPERIACKRNGTIRKVAPVGVAVIVQRRRMIQNETHAFEGDEAVRKLVLDRLELSDRLPELVTLSGVVRRQLEGTPGSTMRARGKHQLPLEQEIAEDAIFQRNEGDRC